MDITYIGDSSFKLKYSKITFLTDPFDPKNSGIKFPKTEADVITLSLKNTDLDINSLVKDYRKVIDGPGEYEMGDVSVIGLHVEKMEKLEEVNERKTSYIFEGAGLRLLHLGNINCDLTSKDVDAIGEVNVLFIPVGGGDSIGSKVASEMVRSIEPNIIIPMHFKLDGSTGEINKLEPLENFLKEVELPVEKTSKLTVKLSELGQESKICVIDRKI